MCEVWVNELYFCDSLGFNYILLIIFPCIWLRKLQSIKCLDIDFSRKLIYINKQIVTIWNGEKMRTNLTNLKSLNHQSQNQTFELYYWWIEWVSGFWKWNTVVCLRIYTPNVICNRRWFYKNDLYDYYVIIWCIKFKISNNSMGG